MTSTDTTASIPAQRNLSSDDELLILFAKLMEGGQEDDETVRELDQLSKVLNEDAARRQRDQSTPSVCRLIDVDCVDTMLGYLDMRQADVVRAHAIVAVASYLSAAGQEGERQLSNFFLERVRRGTYDDYIVAFSVAAATFAVVPDLTTRLFLSEGFLSSLGPLMRRKWKSRKVETACLDMLNVAAGVSVTCRDAIRKYCCDWLEEIVDQDPEDPLVGDDVHRSDPDLRLRQGSIAVRRHSDHVQNLAAVILTKISAVPSSEQQQQQQQKTEDRGGGGGAPVQMQNATTSIEELSNRFTGLLLGTSEHETPTSVEGLAYASVQPKVKESLARNAELLKKLVKVLSDAPPKSSLTFGCLSIFVNLTRYLPALSEEDKQIAQLRAYANASGGAGDPDPLSDNAHVTERCRLVFEAGIVPVLVTRSKDGSPASLGLVVAIVHAIAATQSLRGRLAQQGAVRMLLAAWSALASVAEESAQSTPGSTLKLPSPNHPTPLLPTPPGSDGSVAAAQHTRRLAAHALARILVSTDPSLVFGGDGLRAAAADRAVRPLASLLQEPDSTSSAFTSRTRDLLPTFEALLALTNLASGDQKDADDGSGIANTITQLAFPATEELLLSSNVLVARAAAELVCNLARSPPVARLYGADDSITASEKGRARNRLHVLVALAGSTDARTRSAAGGALAFLTAYPSIVEAVLALERGVTIILALCTEDDEKKAVSVEWEDLAHRGAAILGNMMTQEGSVGAAARKRVRELRGVETLTAVARQARRAEVVEVVVGALKALVEGD